MKLRLLDLFSGIGGFSLGLERSGFFETVAFCEIEPFPRCILKKHWPHVPIYEDVRILTADALRRDGIVVDAICGGFPCQDISLAGKGAGIEGAHSGLWSEYARIIGELRPRVVIVENVSALLGRGLDRVLRDLATLGYDAEWHCIPASAVGAPHRRDRIWIVAHAGNNGFVESFSGRMECVERETCREGREQANGLGRCGYDVANAAFFPEREPADQADAIATRRQAWDELSGGRQYLSDKFGAAISWRECREWESEPDVGRVADGVPRELVFIRGIENKIEQGDSPEGIAAHHQLIGRVLRAMWINRKTAKASPELYARGLHDLVPEMPYGPARGRWFMGLWDQGDEGLCGMWDAFCTASLDQAQDLQRGVLERIGSIERKQALAFNRVDRLKGLGNAVVPQIPEIIGRAIGNRD
jgi:DNA (cytosine-5)-methyltransferase 1